MIELVIANADGVTSVYYGHADTLSSWSIGTDAVMRTTSAPEVTGSTRLYGIVEGRLAYVIEQATTEYPLQPYMSALLERVGGLTGVVASARSSAEDTPRPSLLVDDRLWRVLMALAPGAIFLASRVVCLWIVAWLADRHDKLLVDMLGSWDGLHYAAIAAQGYDWSGVDPESARSPAFFPGLPWLMSLFSMGLRRQRGAQRRHRRLHRRRPGHRLRAGEAGRVRARA